MGNKISQSFELTKQIAKILWKEKKEISLFSLITIGAVIVSTSLIIILYLFLATKAQQYGIDAILIEIIAFFVFYFSLAYALSFSQIGVLIIVREHIRGGDFTFSQAFKEVWKHKSALLKWALFIGTIKSITSFISRRSNWVGKKIISIFGAAWQALVIFSLPIMIFEGKTFKESLSGSAQLFKKTWGELLLTTLFTAPLMSLALIPVIAISFIMYLILVFPAALLIDAYPSSAFAIWVGGDAGLGGTIIRTVPILFYVFVFFVIVNAFRNILVAILYEYAQSGKLPEGFSGDLISKKDSTNQNISESSLSQN